MTRASHDMQIQFLGAVQTVTGSKTLLTVRGKRILVDCGLFQGPKEKRLLNWQEFKDADLIDAVVLTHAHIDHSGYLPKLVREGFRGPIYCTSGTRDLCRILLLDAAHLQEEDAKYADRTRHSHHFPAKPLFTVEDAKQALELFQVVSMNEWQELFSGVSVRFLRAGHILGSSIVQIGVNHLQPMKTITFSGDLGNNRQNVIKGPVSLIETDYLVIESTYGDRLQNKEDPSAMLADCIRKVHAKSGVLVIPSFAVGRTQEILFLLRRLEASGEIPQLPVYLDSPLAIEATNIYLKHREELKIDIDKNGVSAPLCSHCYTTVTDPNDSRDLCERRGPMVVISAAGMITGGRILHHLKARLPQPENIVLFVGYQAEQTKGRLLLQGMPSIRIHHEEVPVRAQILMVDSLSAHADSNDLVSWVKGIEKLPQKVFINHGEEGAARALRYRLENELGLTVEIPSYKNTYNL